MNETRTINESRILYLDEEKEACDLSGHYLHIYGVRVVNGYINVLAYSDSSRLEMYINGRICQRQKAQGVFDFYEPIEDTGLTDIRISSVGNPDLYRDVSVEV